MPRIPDHIKEIALKNEIPDSAFWNCHGTWVCYHKDLEKAAARAGVVWSAPQVIESNSKEAVSIIATGKIGDHIEWSIGEASPKNNKNAYPWAMAEKRAKDRVILKLLGFAGDVYSEEESDGFKAGPKQGKSGDYGPGPVDRVDDGLGEGKNANQTRKDGHWDALKSDMKSACRTIDQLRQWWEATQQEDSFRSMSRDWRQMFKEEVVDSYRDELQMAEAA